MACNRKIIIVHNEIAHVFDSEVEAGEWKDHNLSPGDTYLYVPTGQGYWREWAGDGSDDC